MLNDQIRVTAGAFFIKELVGLGCCQALLRRNDFSCSFTIWISRTSQKLAEAPPLDDHILTAVLAGLIQFILLAFRVFEFTSVLALPFDLQQAPVNQTPQRRPR
ncbi:MAG: hypothetical protein VYB87_01795, partial [Acidobacteriota bacterium]|nr:hypothetical protein [Acidobacteriota bacterium]